MELKWRETQKEKTEKPRGKLSAILSDMATSGFLRPFCAIGGLLVLAQWIGIAVIVVYAEVVFGATGSSLDPGAAPIAVAAVRLAASGMGSLSLRQFARRPIFLSSNFMYTAAALAFASYCHFIVKEEGGQQRGAQGLLPLALTCTLAASFAFGMLPILHATINEVYPTHLRSIGVSLGWSLLFVNLAGMSKTFPAISRALGLGGAFYVYAGFSVLLGAWAWFFLPENKGISLVKAAEKYEEQAESHSMLAGDEGASSAEKASSKVPV